MNEIIGKSKFKNKNLPYRIRIDEKKIIDEKTMAKNINIFFVNIGPKLASKIPVSITHPKQYVTYKGANLERKELCSEEKYLFLLKTNKNPGYDGISSNIIKSVSGEISSWGIFYIF